MVNGTMSSNPVLSSRRYAVATFIRLRLLSLGLVVFILAFIGYLIYVVVDGAKRVTDRQKKQYEAYQCRIDDKLRAESQTEVPFGRKHKSACK